MFFIVVSLKLCAISIEASPCGTSNRTNGSYPDYYWRDYVGTIPLDAVAGGTDKAGKTTYIGQIFNKKFELLPATIYPGCKIARASAYNQFRESDTNVKILCSGRPQEFAWIPVKNEKAHLLTDCSFVLGGSEVEQPLNLGRVNYDGQLIIGKVFSFPLPNRGLYIPYNNKEVKFLSYEILTYGCNKQGFLDVRNN